MLDTFIGQSLTALELSREGDETTLRLTFGNCAGLLIQTKHEVTSFFSTAEEPEAFVEAPICRTDGRCQYAIDHGAEGLGHCPTGKCAQPNPTIDAIMEQAQVFASAWSLVGGRFDHGDMLKDAEAAKAELRQMLVAGGLK